MGEEGFWGLGVIVTAVADRAVWGAESDPPHVELVPRAVTIFRSFVDDLIESWEDVIRELDFSDCGVPGRSEPNCEPRDPLLAQWRVEDALGGVLVEQPRGAAKDATKCDVFTEDARSVIGFHRNVHSVGDRAEHVEFL